MAGFPIPPIKAYAFKLYPTYRGGEVLDASNGTLNSDTAFRTQATEFTPSYGVNTTPDVDRTGDDFYFTVNAGQGNRQANYLTQSPISSALSYDTPITVNPNGTLRTGSIPTTAPEASSLYQDYLDFLEISDLNMTQLMSLPEFQLRNVGMGLKVTTDGFGHADNVVIDLSALGLDRNKGVLDAAFYNLTNREKILLEAALRNNPAANIAIDNLLGLRTGQGQPTDNPFSPNLIGSAASIGRNPVLDKLAILYDRFKDNRLQIPTIDLDLEASRQAAANRANFNVVVKPELQTDVLKLTEKVVAQPIVPVNIPKLDGKLPAPTQLTNGRSMQEVFSGILNANANHPMLSATSDSASKSGSSGLSFYLGSGNPGTDANLGSTLAGGSMMQQGQMGSGSFGGSFGSQTGSHGGFNPFIPQPKKRRFLSYVA